MNDNRKRLQDSSSINLPLDILHNIGDPFRIIDRDFRVLWSNREEGEGYPVGQYCYEAYQRRSTPCPECPIHVSFSSGKACIMEKWFPLPNSSGCWGEIRIYPVYDPRGNIIQAIKIGFDVTKRKRDIEQQTRHIEALENILHKAIQKNTGMLTGIKIEMARFNLTLRELEVLHLMAEGLTNSEISKILLISSHTVKSHVIHIFNKLGVNDRTLAAVTAARLKLI